MKHYKIYKHSVNLGKSNDFSGYVEYSKDLHNSEERVSAFMGYEDGLINLELDETAFAMDYPGVWQWFLRRKLSQKS